MSRTDYQSLFQKAAEYYSGDRTEILSYVSPDVKKTLEFGCGEGNFSVLLKKRFGVETWAVEIHKKSADIAAQKLYRVLCADAEDSIRELPEHYFDSIFFLDMLEHLINPYALLDKCRNKLSSSGVIIASIPNIRYYRAFKEYVFSGKWDYRDHGIMDITHLRFFTYKSIKNMFASLGYEIQGIHGIHPTSSKSYRLLNTLFLNRLWDIRYKHFIVIAGIKK
jgi:2-polyprenyl-3-methyl-5-hydroxy-6-metoxy-1,4-benzoquinol methylase